MNKKIICFLGPLHLRLLGLCCSRIFGPGHLRWAPRLLATLLLRSGFESLAEARFLSERVGIMHHGRLRLLQRMVGVSDQAAAEATGGSGSQGEGWYACELCVVLGGSSAAMSTLGGIFDRLHAIGLCPAARLQYKFERAGHARLSFVVPERQLRIADAWRLLVSEKEAAGGRFVADFRLAQASLSQLFDRISQRAE